MREVGGPHVIILAKILPGRGTDGIVLEGRVQLTPDVLAGRHGQGVSVKIAELLPGVVGPVHVVRQPAGVILGRHDQQLGKALQNAAQDDIRNRLLDLVDQPHVHALTAGPDHVGGRPLAGVLLFPVALFAGHHMQADRHVQLLGGRPEGIVLGAAIRLFARRRTPDHDAPHTVPGPPLQLLDAGLNVFERNQRDPEQAFRVIAAKFAQPVVIGPKTRLLELGVVQTEQRHAERGVQDLGLNPINLLVLDPLGRVPAARPGALIALFPGFGQVFGFVAGGKATRDRKRPQTLDTEKMAFLPVIALDNAGRPVPVFCIQAGLPQVGRLHHMRIRRYHTHASASLVMNVCEDVQTGGAALTVLALIVCPALAVCQGADRLRQ